MTRALISDPYLPQKAKEGRLEDIRLCMGYNEGCIDRQYRGQPMGCVQNAVIGKEAEWAELPKAEKSKRVVIVGGGPAGLEAARVAGMRGHHVTLFEKSDRVGGQSNIARLAPSRGDVDGTVVGSIISCESWTWIFGSEPKRPLNRSSLNSRTPSLSPLELFRRPPISGLRSCGYAASAWDAAR